MLSSRCLRALAPELLALALLAPGILQAQSSSSQQSSSSSNNSSIQPEAQKPPSLIDPAGPQISLQTSEALFQIAAALNACGYDAGLDQSQPVRQKVRDAINEPVKASAEAQNTRDQLCTYIRQHELSEITA